MSYQEDFIKKIAPLCQKFAVKFGYRIVSATIAQACLESGYGTTFKAVNHNNLFGLKYRPDRLTANNGYFQDGSKEQLPNGAEYNITDLWYHFDNYKKCIKGYYEFLNISRYANLKTASTPLQFLTNIKADGYATDTQYIQKCSNIIAKYNLTQFDTLQIDPEPKPVLEENSIIKQCGIANTTVKQGRKIEYIVLHYTAGTNSKEGTAKNVASYFAKSSTKASADFIVDETDIVQYNPDLTNRYTWAVGGSRYSNMTTTLGGRLYGKCTNSNSISIEMCSKKYNTKTLNATDTDWYFEEDVIKNAAILTKYLMQKYNISEDKVIMHHMVTGKICPNPWCVNETSLKGWYNFKDILNENQFVQVLIEDQGTDSNFQVKVLVNDLVIRDAPNGKDTGKRTGKGTFTIIKTQSQWGLLKSQAGWIYLGNERYTQRI